VTPKRAPDSPRPVDYYQYRSGAREQRFAPEDVIFFRYPDPRDPYTGGLSPLRACFEQAALASEYAATRSAIYENRALPSALVSPDAVMGEEERPIADRGRCLAPAGRIDVGDRHARAFGGERHCHRAPQPRCAAGDVCGLAGKAPRHGPLLTPSAAGGS